MIAPLARLPLARLTRTPRAWLPIVGWTALAVVAAYVTRGRGSAHGADHVLLGAFGGIALPLLVYGVVSATLGGDGLARSGASLVAFGAPPARVATVSVLVTALASAVLGAALAAAVAFVAHGSGDPPVVRDILTSAWIGGLGGAAYAAMFTLGACFGKRGAGRSAVLVVDWIFGSGYGALSCFFPRAHVRNLLGGDPSLELTQGASAMMLGGLVVVYAALAVVRASRR